jgi:hypothetical protein
MLTASVAAGKPSPTPLTSRSNRTVFFRIAEQRLDLLPRHALIDLLPVRVGEPGQERLYYRVEEEGEQDQADDQPRPVLHE